VILMGKPLNWRRAHQRSKPTKSPHEDQGDSSRRTATIRKQMSKAEMRKIIASATKRRTK
jgi:hypothetical protein